MIAKDKVGAYGASQTDAQPNAKLHATLHAMVETRMLGEETPTRRAAQPLMEEGLDRHDAIQAIGWVLIEFMSDLMDAPDYTEPNARYFAALERLTVEE